MSEIVDDYAQNDLPPIKCGSCRACCTKDRVPVLPEQGDRVMSYQTRMHGGKLLLAIKPGTENVYGQGECVYLGPEGCTIYGRRPFACRTFDCRVFYRRYSSEQRKGIVRQRPHFSLIFRAGRQRL